MADRNQDTTRILGVTSLHNIWCYARDEFLYQASQSCMARARL